MASRLALREQILNLDRQFTHSNAGCVMHCCCHGGGEAGQADLADPAGAELVELFVGKVEEMHLDLDESEQ